MTTQTTPARKAAEKIVRIFGQFVSMHVNDILPDIEEACRTHNDQKLEEVALWCEEMEARPGRSEWDCGEANAYTQAELFIRSKKSCEKEKT